MIAGGPYGRPGVQVGTGAPLVAVRGSSRLAKGVGLPHWLPQRPVPPRSACAVTLTAAGPFCRQAVSAGSTCDLGFRA